MQNLYDELLLNYTAHHQTELKSRHSPIRTISDRPISFPPRSLPVLRQPAIDSPVTETECDDLAEKLGALQFAACRKCPIHQLQSALMMHDPLDFNVDEQMKASYACSISEYDYSIHLQGGSYRQGAPPMHPSPSSPSHFFTCSNPHGRKPIRQFRPYRFSQDDDPSNTPPLEAAMCIIYEQAKDPNASAILQRMIDEGTLNAGELGAICDGIIGHVAELAENSLANHLVQKIIDHCGEEGRMAILLDLTKDPHALLRIALNDYGYPNPFQFVSPINVRLSHK